MLGVSVLNGKEPCSPIHLYLLPFMTQPVHVAPLSLSLSLSLSFLSFFCVVRYLASNHHAFLLFILLFEIAYELYT
jgi:hypothetical protein